MKIVLHRAVQLLPLIILSIFWQLASDRSDKIRFLFASPVLIISKLFAKIADGELLLHSITTAFEALSGFVLGTLVGSIIGFLLLYFPKVSKISSPYLIALSSIPIFGIAPMMIIWFGVGIDMKVAMAFFSTVFVSVSQAYKGGQNISTYESEFFLLNRASNNQKFWGLVFPSSIEWLFQSLRLNSGLALLGAFIGEFIASDKGLGFVILKASGLYDVPYVLAAVICIILLSVLFNYAIMRLEKQKLNILRLLIVKYRF